MVYEKLGKMLLKILPSPVLHFLKPLHVSVDLETVISLTFILQKVQNLQKLRKMHFMDVKLPLLISLQV